MTGIQASLGEIDQITAPRTPSARDPLARLLASRQTRPNPGTGPRLRALVERAVVPKLVRSFRQSGVARADSEVPVSSQDKTKPASSRSGATAAFSGRAGRLAGAIEAFGQSLLASDIEGAAGMVEAFEEDGLSLESIYLHFLLPVADHLEELWMDDRTGFAETAIGMHNLTTVLRRFGPAFRQDVRGEGPGRGCRALLLGSPSRGLESGRAFFGLVFAAEFFRRDMWDTSIEPNLAGGMLRHMVADTWFDTISIGPCTRRDLDQTAAAIQTIRRFSANRAVLIFAYGQILVENAELPRLIGADVVSPDAQSSLIQAKQFVSPPKPRARLR